MKVSGLLIVLGLFFLFFIVPGEALADSFVMATFNQVDRAEDEIITVCYLDGKGKNQEFVAKTGDEAKPGDDLPKNLSGIDRALRVAEAINTAPDNNGDVTAQRVDDPNGRPTNVLMVVVNAPNTNLKTIKTTNNTKQRGNTVQIVKRADSAAQVVHHQSKDQSLGCFIYFSGSVSGLDDDGYPSVVELGTGAYEAEIKPTELQDVSDVVELLAKELRRNGVPVELVCPMVLKIMPLEGQVVYGCTDIALDMTIEVGYLDEY